MSDHAAIALAIAIAIANACAVAHACATASANAVATADANAAMTWHILTTVPGRERVLAASLAARSVMAYCPLMRLSRRRIVALFPGYLFCGLDRLAERVIAELDEGRPLMRPGDRPATLSHTTIIEIAATAQTHADTWQQPFRLRDEVEVNALGGPWQGLRGLVARLDGPDRVVVEAMLPAAASRISVRPQWLEPASPQSRTRHRAGA